jgi:hypothetical protein
MFTLELSLPHIRGRGCEGKALPEVKGKFMQLFFLCYEILNASSFILSCPFIKFVWLIF